MIRLRNLKARIYHHFSALRRAKPAVHDGMSVRMAQVASAVHQRELIGASTTLRQVHKISGLSQPEALNIVAELERAQIVVIDRNTADAFESTIILSEEARRRLDQSPDGQEAASAA